MLRAILSSPLNILLLAAPASWVADATAPGSPWVFITAAVSLVPLAGLIGLGTEQLARALRAGVGGFLNATFGNAAELIIALVALRNGHVALVKASITGSIVGNLLLVLGLSFFVGGLGRKSQKFHRTAATNTAAMLFLAVVALVMPAVFDLSLYGTLNAHPKAHGSTELLERARADRGLRRQPDLRVHRAPRSVPAGRRSRARAAAICRLPLRSAARSRHRPDDGSGRDSRRRHAAGAHALRADRAVRRRDRRGPDRQRGRALLRRDRGPARRDDAGGRNLRRQQRADRALRRARARPLFVRDRPADVAALQPVRDHRDRAVGAGDVVRRGRRREQLGGRAAAVGGLSHPRAGVLFRPWPVELRRWKAMR